MFNSWLLWYFALWWSSWWHPEHGNLLSSSLCFTGLFAPLRSGTVNSNNLWMQVATNVCTYIHGMLCSRIQVTHVQVLPNLDSPSGISRGSWCCCLYRTLQLQSFSISLVQFPSQSGYADWWCFHLYTLRITANHSCLWWYSISIQVIDSSEVDIVCSVQDLFLYTGLAYMFAGKSMIHGVKQQLLDKHLLLQQEDKCCMYNYYGKCTGRIE